jgi:hypothetical protein
MTHDIDFVISVKENEVGALVGAFPRPEFYVDVSAARDAVAHRSMFNLINVREGDKVAFGVLDLVLIVDGRASGTQVLWRSRGAA